MDDKIKKLLTWIPRSFSILVVIFFVTFYLLMIGKSYIAGGILVAILLLAILVAWVNEPIGGGILLILSALGLAVAMGMQFPIKHFLIIVPVFLGGSLFIVINMYKEKKEGEENVL